MSESTPTSDASGADWETLARGAASGFRGEGQETVQVLRELLVFGLDGAAYAVPVERVREIVRMRELTTIPRAPAWLLGVVALRGEVVEVVDLRRRLGLGASTPDRSNRIIVLHGDADRVTGLLVDSVSEVYRIGDDEVLPAQGLDVASVSEVCPRGEEFVSILDVERALGVTDG
ncbi:MAG: chemotaxis protein CheW [Myxococcota bacterium]